MSKKICHRDREYKLNQILEQVEALSDVVDELRTELNYLKKIPFNVNQENIYFEYVKDNKKIDYASPSLWQKVKRYFETDGVSTKIDETCELARNSQVFLEYIRNDILETINFLLKYIK